MEVKGIWNWSLCSILRQGLIISIGLAKKSRILCHGNIEFNITRGRHNLYLMTF